MSCGCKKEIFLIEGTVHKSPYMEDTEYTSDLQIVEANDKNDARDKILKYWEDQSSDYSVTYYFEIESIKPVIK